MKIKGIHHISNIVNHPQENIEFYTSLMGLRLIKKAVNFDDAKTYHFYYGNHNADLGTVITSFPIGENTHQGVKGGGQVVSTYYTIPNGSFDFWYERLKKFDLNLEVIERFNQRHLVFSDYLGIVNELVENESGYLNEYEFNGVTKNNAIKNFYGALINSIKPKETLDFFINILDAKLELENKDYYRLSLNSEIGNYLDINKNEYSKGRLSKGTVHHIAFGVSSEEDLVKFKDKIESLNIYVGEIKERHFFKAIYFKEPGGTIIELSTMSPGFSAFMIDDKGSELFLPNHFESQREIIEKSLVPVYIKPVSKLKRYFYENKIGYEKEIEFQTTLSRINELSKLSKKRTLTTDELNEQKDLRNKYLETFKNNFKNQMDNVIVEDEIWS